MNGIPNLSVILQGFDEISTICENWVEIFGFMLQ